jgi:hypothetical protein
VYSQDNDWNQKAKDNNALCCISRIVRLA